MQVQLLPKKSSTAIQSKLHSCTQNNLSIDEYGKLFTELLVDMTVLQSDRKPENYKVLKPINEKQAIKRFAEGWRNRRLSTIIAAPNFNSLKNAIQPAVDEETEASSSLQGEIRAFNKIILTTGDPQRTILELSIVEFLGNNQAKVKCMLIRK